MRNEFVSRLAIVDPGQAITLRFPDLIVGRVTYLRVNSAASQVFGAGNYRLTKPPGSRMIRVARLR